MGSGSDFLCLIDVVEKDLIGFGVDVRWLLKGGIIDVHVVDMGGYCLHNQSTIYIVV